MAQVRLEDVDKRFGETVVAQGVSLNADEGRFTVILGPSGCGKSTLLRIIAGLEAADAGRVYIGRQEVSGLPPRKRDVAMVFQSYALYPHLDVRGNLAFPLKVRGGRKAEIDQRVRQAAELLGITELLAKRPRQLSGGQRQRVAMGRAMVRRPACFLFDEPLSNLDAPLRAGMRLELARLHRELAATMLYVTHDQVEAMTLGDQIVLLNKGRVQQAGPPQAVYDRPANLFVAGFLGSPAMNLLEGRVAQGEAGPEFHGQGLDGAIALGPGAAAHAGGEAVLGLRPEELTPTDAASPLAGRLELVERVGGEAVLYLEAGGQRLAAKAAADWQGRPGQAVRLGLGNARPHLFIGGQRVSLREG